MDQIAFSSLLIGLLVGVQPVSVEVAPALSPAAVVFSLDGKPVARVQAPPWKAMVDFGQALRPREISAEAVDSAGARLAGISRVVNLPLPPARLDILISRNSLGVPTAARLVATSVRKERPVRETLTLDGAALTIDARSEAGLPPLDLKKTHVLSATAEFAQDAVARADVALGGGVTDESGSRLTAVPIRVPAGANPTLETLAGRFRHAGQPLRVVAVDRGPASVLLVRDPSSRSTERMLGRNTPGTGVRLEPTDRVGLVWPLSHEEKVGDQQTQLLESTPYFTGKEGGLLWVLTRVSRQKPSTPPYRYADAVAVAGLEAHRSAARRAVVLVGIHGADASELTPGQVRGYLDVLGVPLHVWSLGSTESPWGEHLETVTSFVAYQRASTALKKDLDTQRIVWIAGEWMPGQVELAPGAEDVTLLR